MPPYYNPVVRTFNRVRNVLVNTLGVERRRICPAMPLDHLIPRERILGLWRELGRAGFATTDPQLLWPDLMPDPLIALEVAPSLSLRLLRFVLIVVFFPVWLILFLEPKHPPQHRNSQTRPLELWTMGHLVLMLTSHREHARSGYRWSRREIAFRVRFMVADFSGLSLAEVREDTRFLDL